MNPFDSSFKLPDSLKEADQVTQLKAKQNMAAGAQSALATIAKTGYHWPRTKEEWWDNVDKYWDYLILIFQRFLNLRDPSDLTGDLSVKSLLENIIEGKRNRDYELANIFQAVWEIAPDDGSIHSIPGWNVLYDLCSESCLVNPEGLPEEFSN